MLLYQTTYKVLHLTTWIIFDSEVANTDYSKPELFNQYQGRA